MLLYTTHCPKCHVLSSKLDNAAMSYDVCDDVEVMRQKGITSVPMLEVDGELLTFKEAEDWINNGCNMEQRS